jgi:hypothetical protein
MPRKARRRRARQQYESQLYPLFCPQNALAVDWFPTMLFPLYVHDLFLLSTSYLALDLRRHIP